MKTIWIFGILAFFLAAPAVSGADLPDLVGTWEGPDMGYDPLEGYYGEGENYTVTLTIAEQRGRLFNGTIAYLDVNDSEVVEGLAGVIAPDNTTFYIAEFIAGYDLGTIISEDEIELLYLRDGEMGGVSLDILRRVPE